MTTASGAQTPEDLAEHYDRPARVASGQRAGEPHRGHDAVVPGQLVRVAVEQDRSGDADGSHETDPADGVETLPFLRLGPPLRFLGPVVRDQHGDPEDRECQDHPQTDQEDGIVGPEPGDDRDQEAADHTCHEGAYRAEQRLDQVRVDFRRKLALLRILDACRSHGADPPPRRSLPGLC